MLYLKAAEMLQRGESFVLAHIVDRKDSAPRGAGAKMIVRKDSSIIGTVGGGPLEATIIGQAVDSISNKKSKLLRYDLAKDLGMQCGGHVQVYIEAVSPPPRLVIVGAGHIGTALARMVAEFDWQVYLADCRQEVFAGFDIPRINKLLAPTYAEALRDIEINDNTYLVIVTKDADLEVLEATIKSPAKYIGMIGSHKKAAYMKKCLLDKGVDEALFFQRLYSPVGLSIFAETPSEIAVSILGQLIFVMRSDES
jgi:xanthine dehydrogenase accessory factor